MTPHHGSSSLTPRETAVLRLIVDGCTSKVAAGILKVSPRTVEFHRANIMLKMDARNIAELMRIVFGSGPGPH
jgi:two-component system, LuxR family, response regulator FixJ